MIKGFWQNLERPIIGLAPMDGVSDPAFRYIVAKYGKPALIITEFTAAEGIRAGAERLLVDFYYDPIERPVVAQLFGSDPSAFFVAAVVVSALGFDGIDINMGCPAKNITEKGAGAALILDPPRAREIIRQTKAGNQAWVEGGNLEKLGVPPNLIPAINKRRTELGIASAERSLLPVSIKTRLGYDQIVISEWVKHLLSEEPATITIHGRTLKQQYTGQANWEAIGQAAAIIHQTETLVLGNGDLESVQAAKDACQLYGTDGALIGRASFGNPWLFQEKTVSFEEKMTVALEHARYLSKIINPKAFVKMRKHLLDYCKGHEGAKELRIQLMKVTSLEEVESILLPTIEKGSGGF